jgi:hypothetical protein
MVTFGSSGGVGLVDTRESNLVTSRQWKLFSKGSPKTVSVHPVDKHLMLVPNNKAECSIFDIRSVPATSSSDFWGKKSVQIQNIFNLFRQSFFTKSSSNPQQFF